MSQPNIVFILADQLAAKWLGCYGSGIGSTPTLDRLAREGVCFTRYYASHPVCTPNRATILTGRSAEIHGMVWNNYALATDMPTYAHVLREHGYRLGGFGKFHQTPMGWPAPTDLSWLGFDEAVVSEDPKWGPYMDWVREFHPSQYEAALAMANGYGIQGTMPEVERRQGASEEQIAIRQRVYQRLIGDRIAASEWERMYVSPISPEAHDTTFITEMGLDFIRRNHRGGNLPIGPARSGAPDGGDGVSRPFFCHISYVDPHDPYDPPECYASLFEPDDMPLPLPAEWMEQGPAGLVRVHRNYLQFGKIANNMRAVQKMRALYHGSLKLMDDQISRIVDYLETSGLWENTILVFSSDHGDHLGDHGLITKGLGQYDAGIRCPLIVAGGPVQARGPVDRLSCTLDIYPTFCDWAGVADGMRPPLEGKSFAGECVTDPLQSRDAVESPRSERWEDVSISIAETESIITDDRWRLTRYVLTGEGQLFDLAADPGESRNLYGKPEHLQVQTELLERMIAGRVRPRLLPHYRNIPVRANRKHRTETRDAEPPTYSMEPCPWLSGELGPHRGEENEDVSGSGAGSCAPEWRGE